MHAAGDLSIRSGQDTLGNANTSQSKAIGTVQISDTEKFSGWHRQQHEDDSAQVSQVASNIGSLGGSVNLSAGGSYSQIASNVVAAQDINITATSIELLAAGKIGHSSQRDDDLKIGAFARVKSPLIDLVNNVDAARQSDGRLQQMQGMAAAANAYQAASAVAAVSGAGGSGTLAAAEAGIGFKSASSSANSHSVVSQGSTLQAGGNLNLTSTGGDIHVVQGNLSAGNSLSLDSAGDILLEAGKSQLADRSQSSNAGAEVGMGASVGAQTGVYAYAEASVGSSRSNATSSTWHNTTLSGQQISLQAAGDTTLRGATATADRIDVTTGGTLTIESLQDVAQSESKNSQVGGRVQVSFGTAWDASGYASGGKADGNYQAVGEQSGLFAGDGGYHVQAGHVNLVGGAIASTNAGNSALSAQTLTFSDLHNSMNHQASSGSISGGFGGKAGEYQGTGTELGRADSASFGGGVPMTESGSDRSTTHATLTEGNIVIGGQQTSAAALGINTDAAAAHRALDAMPNAEQQLANQQAMAAAMGTVVGTSKQIAGDIQAHQANKAVDAYFAGLSPDDQTRFIGLDAAAQDREMSANSPAYQNAKQWGIGGANSRALEAVTTLLVGATSGQVGSQVVANALAPYAAQLIGETFDPNKPSAVPSEAMQLLSHALLGALLAEVNGGNAASGAGAAAGGELAAKLITEALYPGKVGDLDDNQKANILALSQAVGALAGGIGSDLAGAALGAEVAGNVVENNYLSAPQRRSRDAEHAACANDLTCVQATAARWSEVSQEQSLEVMAQYDSYLSYEERNELLSLKPGAERFDEILASAISRGSSEKPYFEGVLSLGVINLLREKDWDGWLMGAPGHGLALTEKNRIEMAILGPIFGAPSAVMTALGADPENVAMANQMGVIGWDAVSLAVPFGPKGTIRRSPAASVTQGDEYAIYHGLKNKNPTGSVTSGAENVAGYPKLKDQLVQQNWENISAQDSRLAAAVNGSGTSNPNFSIGIGTAADAERLGRIWVGDGARRLTDGSGLVSADGVRVYRFPREKDSMHATTGVQANFERYLINPVTGGKSKVSNGHLNINRLGGD